MSLLAANVSKRNAYKAALLHLQSKLHVSGALRDLANASGPPESSGLDFHDNIATSNPPKHPKLEVYDNVAKFGLIPQFNTQVQPPSKKNAKRTVTVTILARELDITGTGTGPGLELAEIRAGVKINQMINQKQNHLQHKKLAKPLQTSTAKEFFDFYTSTVPKLHVNLCQQANVSVIPGLNDRDLERNAAVVHINGQVVGEPAYFASKQKAMDAAYLTASLSIIKNNADLLDRFNNRQKNTQQPHNQPPIRFYPARVGPLDLDIDFESIQFMRDTCESFRDVRATQEAEQSQENGEAEWTPHVRPRPRLTKSHIEARNSLLKERQARLEKDALSSELNQAQAKLPLRQHASQVLQMVDNNDYSIIVGATGCGKTTQVPQLLLEQAIASGKGARCNIVCTQPRQIAAKSVARRVASERQEFLQNTVGYQVRFDSKPPIPGGSINYCTTGTLLAQLENDTDAVLDDTSHVVLDEVHERDMPIDFLMVVLKKALATRQQANKRIPKVILMSATVDTNLFADYFQTVGADGATTQCPSISIPGRLYPVKEHFLHDVFYTLRDTYKAEFESFVKLDRATKSFLAAENTFARNYKPNGAGSDGQCVDRMDPQVPKSDEMAAEIENEAALVPIHLVAATLAHISKQSSSGAILTFLPGIDEINKVNKILLSQSIFGIDFAHPSNFKIIKLHADLPDGQNEVFEPVPPGCRKIILATNIAETSITIPEVQFVVDSGKVREKQYSPVHRISRLLSVWESKSNVTQRAGRAGRVQDGRYFGLFSRERYESLPKVGLPELLRTDLQSLCLSVKLHSKNTSIRDFLTDALQPPTGEAIEASIQSLQALQALSKEGELTPLGQILARLPVHPTFGKMIVLGIIFKCFDPMLVMGAAQDQRPLFYRPAEVRQDAIKAQADYYEGTSSDQVALVNAYRELRQIRDEQGQIHAELWARDKFLNINSFIAIERTTEQIENVLVGAGLIPRTHSYEREYSELGAPRLNENSGKVAVVKALITAGCYPNIAIHSGGMTLRTASETGTIIHPTSVNFVRSRNPGYGRRNLIYAFASMQKSPNGNTVQLKDTTLITPLMALLFGGQLDVKQHGIVEMDDWLSYYPLGDRAAAMDLLRFRRSLDTVSQFH